MQYPFIDHHLQNLSHQTVPAAGALVPRRSQHSGSTFLLPDNGGYADGAEDPEAWTPWDGDERICWEIEQISKEA
jgi:hypothetical protein